MTAAKDMNGGPERWMLYRAKRDPFIYPFESEQDAEQFRDDHPSLIDYKPRRNDDPEREHEPYCGRCNEKWPCKHIRVENQAKMILHHEANACHRCHKQVSGMRILVKAAGEFGEDLLYHGRKGACRNQAIRDLTRLGHTDVLERLEQEAAAEVRFREQRQRVRERIATGATWREAWGEEGLRQA